MEESRHRSRRIPLDDTRIVELYWDRDESAIDETDLKYRHYLSVVAYNIVHSVNDTEECVSDTYLGAWNSMPPHRPGMLKAFLSTIVRRSAINRYNSKIRQKDIPSELTSSLDELDGIVGTEDSTQGDFDALQLGELISRYLRELNGRQRYIFISRYYFAEPIKVIAERLCISRSSVNKEIALIKSGLRERLESEGYTV